MTSNGEPTEASATPKPQTYEYVNDFTANPPPTRFRFKSAKQHRSSESASDTSHHHHHRSSKRHRTRSPIAEDDRTDADPQPRVSRHWRTHHHHHHHHRSKRRTKSPDGTTNPTAPRPATPSIDPDTAFRESLFDALADDEGAAFWESVYGQPIHTYPRPAVRDADPLDLMSDEEYTSYVRGKMWEKSHEAVFEERRRREGEKRRRKEEGERRRKEGGRMEGERERFAREVEESLARGKERKKEREWVDAWKKYTTSWDELTAYTSTPTSNSSQRPSPKIPWPTRTGNPSDITAPEIEAFFRRAAPGGGALRDTLKRERIRWHPDKMQQRFGVDDAALKRVTAVFQVVDDMWARTLATGAGA